MSKLNRDAKGMPIPPRRDWPMNAHPNGQWYRKKGKKPFYFGAWDDWREAEKNFDWRWPFISAGKPDPKDTTADEPAPDAGTFHVGCNLFLASKLADRAALRISDTHYAAIKRDLAYLLNFEPDDRRGALRGRKIDSVAPATWKQLADKLEDEYGTHGRKNMIGTWRECFTWIADNGHGARPTLGGELRAPTKLEIRNERRSKVRERGEMIFPREQIKPILDRCDMPLDAMFLLALNTGSIAADVAALRLDELNLDKGEFRQSRVKTGVERFCFLWPETVKALREAIKVRPKVDAVKLAAALAKWKQHEPKSGKEARRRWESLKPEWDKLVFLTQRGQPWVRVKVREDDVVGYYEGVGLEFRKVLIGLDKKFPDGKGGVAFKRAGINFKVCRHTFYSAARRIDLDGARYMMGHADESMGSWYDHLDDTKLSIIREIADWTRYVFLGQTSEGHAGFRLRLAGFATDAVAAAG